MSLSVGFVDDMGVARTNVSGACNSVTMANYNIFTNPITEQKPPWLKIKLPTGNEISKYERVKQLTKSKRLHTICVEAKCPNLNECWSGGTATFLLMGDVCTRYCRFCHTKSARNGVPMRDLEEEPAHLADAVDEMKLEYVVLTSVDRDDLADQGSKHFATCVNAVKTKTPKVKVELLIGDFRGDEGCLKTVVASGAEVIGHNVETVERLQATVRDRRANYQQSLGVLSKIKKLNPALYTKTALMLGLGETDEEIEKTMDDLRAINCDIITFGQYLQPSKRHIVVQSYVAPEKFAYWQKIAEKKGFLYCASGPYVRSSYRAGEFFMKGIIGRKQA